MNESIKFDPKKLEKLNNPDRIKYLNPDIIWKTLNLKTPKVIIDIGAGTGFFALLFCEKMNQGKIYACDTSDIMVEWMKKNISSNNCAIIPTKSNENTIYLPESIADLVYLINVYHELEEPSQILAESYRLLKDNGKIAIIDWKAEETPEGPPIAHRISENNVIEQLNKSNFYNIENAKILPYHYFITAQK